MWVPRLVGAMPVAGTAHAESEKLTRRHMANVLLVAGVSVEDVGYAMGEVVGFESVKSAFRMNGVMVIFLDDVSSGWWRAASLSGTPSPAFIR